jgi:hypothetical protein
MKQKYKLLNNRDIMQNPFMYDYDTIEWNLQNSFLNLRTLVNYQKLSPYICAKYVVFGGTDEKYASCTEDAWIATGEIPYYQPHITMEDMHIAHGIVDDEEENEINESKLMKKEDKKYRNY